MAEGTEELQASLDEFVQFNAHMKKYLTLRKRCEQVQQVNEKLINRLNHVKQMIKKCKKERRLLITRLDEHGDSYKDIQVQAVGEESQSHDMATPPVSLPQYSSGPSATPPIASGAAALLHAMGATPPPPYPQVTPGINPFLPSHEGLPLSSLGASSSNQISKSERDFSKNKTANAFLLYCQHRRQALLEEYLKDYQKEMPQHELTKQLAEEWSTLTTDQKKVYSDLLDKEREQRQQFSPKTNMAIS